MCSACRLMVLYICVKFRENIMKGISYEVDYMVEMATFNVQRVITL